MFEKNMERQEIKNKTNERILHRTEELQRTI